MTRLADRWLQIHSPEIDLSKYNKLTYDEEDIKAHKRRVGFSIYVESTYFTIVENQANLIKIIKSDLFHTLHIKIFE